MKIIISLAVALAAVEQTIKLCIAHFLMTTEIIIIPNLLLFRPVQNTNLLYIASLNNYTPPVAVVAIFQIFAAIILVVIFRYMSCVLKSHKKLFTVSIAIAFSGVLCSFIDVVFWGGSLDYIRLFDWFTFDLKDAYLSLSSVIIILILLIIYAPLYYRLTKDERKKQGIMNWIKLGMPTKLTK